jgi:hypothetical protein
MTHRAGRVTLPPLASLSPATSPLPEPVPVVRSPRRRAGVVDREYAAVVLHLRRLSPEQLGAALRLLVPTQRQLLTHIVLEGRSMAAWCVAQKRRGLVAHRSIERGRLEATLDLLGEWTCCPDREEKITQCSSRR